MMKTKMTQWVLTATLTFCGAIMMLTSCTDAIGTADNPVNPNPPYDPADELASETFTHEDWMDRSTKPGDSFWQYALGSWLENHEISDMGTMIRAQLNQSEDLKNGIGKYETSNHTLQLILGPKPSEEEQMAVLQSVLAQLKDDENLSKADLIRNIGKVADLGFCALMGHDVICIDGTMKYYIMPGLISMSILAGYNLSLEKYVEINLKPRFQKYFGMDINDPKVIQLITDVGEIDIKINELRKEWIYSYPVPSIIGSGRSLMKSTPLPALQAMARAMTRTALGDDELAAFREAFHIDAQTYYLPEVDKVFELIQQYDVQSLQQYLKFYLYEKLHNTIIKSEDTPSDIYDEFISIAPSIFIDYQKAVLLKDADCEGARQVMEEMRELFAERINALDWLSDATKTKALKKLQSMKFNIGAPETLFNDNFKLTGNTPIEDLIQYKQQADDYLRNVLPGKPGVEYGWEFLLLSPNGSGIDVLNAYYEPLINQIFILPVFLKGELFPADKNDAMRYATLMVFGHEMTHGFDSTGAMFDDIGKKTDWWAPEDKAKFVQRRQMIVERYNELEQIPGVKADGEKTKNENIADLCGLNLAWEIWNRKLKTDELTGEALRHQQRQFFLEIAHLWQFATDEKNLKDQLETDVHSANHNRVNGVMRLIDDWYDLFGVEPGDKLYVKPADRVKIW